MIAPVTQRWRARRATYRPVGETLDALAMVAERIRARGTKEDT